MYISRPAKLLFTIDQGWNKFIEKFGDNIIPWAHSQSKRNKVTHCQPRIKSPFWHNWRPRCMQGKHLTQKERFYIEKCRGDGVNQASIAKELELPRSTISRELRRNTAPTFNGLYSCRRAHTLSRERRHKPLPDNAFHRIEPHAQDFIRQELSTHTSPEVISGRLLSAFGIFISKNTLYRGCTPRNRRNFRSTIFSDLSEPR